MQSKIEDGMERSKEMAKMIEDVEEDDEVSERARFGLCTDDLGSSSQPARG